MYINNNTPNLNFGIKLDTAKVLEVTSVTIFKSDGTQGCKEVINALSKNPIKATGFRGFKSLAEKFGKQITDNYPEIKKATDEILAIKKSNPNIKKNDLYEQIKPIIEKIGDEVDIVI